MSHKVSIFRSAAIIWIITIGLITSTAAVSAAQSVGRPVVFIDSLLTSPDNVVTVDQAVQFDVNSDVVLLLASQNIIAISWDFGDDTVIRTTVISDREHVYTEPGIYTARLELIGFHANYSSTVIVEVHESPPPPQFDPVIEVISNYDVNDNNLLSDIEFFLIVDAWVAGDVDDTTFFAAVDIWVGNDSISSISSSGASAFTPLATPAGPNGITFSAAGTEHSNLAVQVYDTNGSLIYSASRAGNELHWNLRENNGAPVANGTYFYAMTAVNHINQQVVSAPQALVVLR